MQSSQRVRLPAGSAEGFKHQARDRSVALVTVIEVETGRVVLDMEKYIEVRMPPNTPKAEKANLKARVESVDIGHALRASLQFEQSDGARTTSYSSLEVGINMHLKIPEQYQQGDDFKQVVDAYADEVLKMVGDRIKRDSRSLGLVAIIEQPEQDRFEQLDADSGGMTLDDAIEKPAPAPAPKKAAKKAKAAKKS